MRKNIMMGLPGILISLCGAGQSLPDDSTTVTTLREVVVSATRTAEPVIEIPRSVTVINRDILEKSIYQSLGELLNAESGIYVVGANQTPGTNQNVFMRGASSNQVAVMVDGVRITDPSSPNSAIDLSEISLTNIEKIEIIRGSHSTMYGGAAIGGVINIITKSKGSPGFHGLAGLQAGTMGKNAYTFAESVELNYASDNGYYVSGSLFQQNVTGLDATDKMFAASVSSDKDDFRKTDAMLKAGYNNNKLDGFISFKKTHQHAELDNAAFFDDDNYYLTFDRNFLEYRVGYTPNAFWKFSLLGSLSASERYYKNDSSRVDDISYDKAYSSGTYHGRLQTHEGQLNFDNKKFKGVFGVGLYYEKMLFDSYFFYNDPAFPFELSTNYDSIDTSTKTAYTFAQLGYTLGNFSIAAGSRLSHHTTAGTYVTYELNPSYHLNNFTLYGSWTSGYNAPSLYQLYDPSKSFYAFTSRGNMNLESEESFSIELGVKKDFSSGSYITVSAFQTTVDNSIEYIYLWNGSKPVAGLDFTDERGDTYINVARQRVEGLEAEAVVVISGKLSVSGNVTALKGQTQIAAGDLKDQPTGGNHVQLFNFGTFLSDNFTQEHLVRRPGLTSFMQLKYRPHSAWSLTCSHRYTGSRFDSQYNFSLGGFGALDRKNVASYHLLDAGLHWQATKAINVGIKVENLLDEKYREVLGFQTRGRSLYFKLMARW